MLPASILVVPNYHVYLDRAKDNRVFQKPNEVQFYAELRSGYDKVSLAAAWKHPDVPNSYRELDPGTIEYVSLGEWERAPSRFRKIAFYISAALKLRQLISGAQFLYLYLPGTNSLLAGIIAATSGKRYGIYLRGGVKHAGSMVERTYRYLLRRSSFVICTGIALEKYAAAYAKETYQVSPMTAFTVDDACKPAALTAERPIELLYVGVLNADKGVFDLLRIAKCLKARGEQFNLTMIGNSTKQVRAEISATIRRFGIGDDVSLLDFTDDPGALREAYKRAHVFLFPSVFNEGFPRVIYEAMLMGCAILAYRLPVYEGSLIDGVNCVLCEPSDYEALCGTISNFHANLKCYEQIAHRGQQFVIEHLMSIAGARHGKQVADCDSAAQSIA